MYTNFDLMEKARAVFPPKVIQEVERLGFSDRGKLVLRRWAETMRREKVTQQEMDQMDLTEFLVMLRRHQNWEEVNLDEDFLMGEMVSDYLEEEEYPEIEQEILGLKLDEETSLWRVLEARVALGRQMLEEHKKTAPPDNYVMRLLETDPQRVEQEFIREKAEMWLMYRVMNEGAGLPPMEIWGRTAE